MTNNVLANVQNLIPPNAPTCPKKKRNRKRKKKGKSPATEGMGHGRYNCPKCKAQWASPNSLADISQACKTCATPVLPVMSPPGKKLTPYQGSKRTFGEYKCTGCDKIWCSAYSWANMGQECKDCLINIYPHMQRPLLRKKGTSKKPHLDRLCEKCKTQSHCCTGLPHSLK